MKQDDFGDRMKQYESAFTNIKVYPDKFLCVRIDGKKFSKFTKGFEKPFDNLLTNLMIETTKHLMSETHATIGYTQSDEITLIYKPRENESSTHIFGGKVSKINSILASTTTAFFNRTIFWNKDAFEEHYHKSALFDCRSWSVDGSIEASNVILWRVQDARKNSVSAMFRWTCGHKAMQNLNSDQMIEHMKNSGYFWDQLNKSHKYGTILKRVSVEEKLSFDVIEKIPESKRPVDNMFKRNIIKKVDDIEYFGDMNLSDRVSLVNGE